MAAAAGTTVPAVRRRFGSKASVAVAVIDSLRAESMPAESGPPRSRALAVLPALRRALAEGISSGQLPDSADSDVLASMLIGSFYARYIATSDIPDDWAERTLRQVWPDAPQHTAMSGPP